MSATSVHALGLSQFAQARLLHGLNLPTSAGCGYQQKEKGNQGSKATCTLISQHPRLLHVQVEIHVAEITSNRAPETPCRGHVFHLPNLNPSAIWS